MPYIKTEDHITVVFDDGETATVYNNAPNYNKVVSAVKSNNWEQVRMLTHPSEQLQKTIDESQSGDKRVQIQHGVVYLDDKPIHNSLADRMIQMVEEGFDVSHMSKFLINLMDNPSYRAVTELYGFLEHSDLPITEDGCFVAYKRVTKDYKDIHTNTFDNSIGATVEMPRNEVDDNKEVTCSNGLHFCSREYLSMFGTGPDNRTIVVKINPADVVSIPVDYNNSKGRCCKYVVINELKHGNEEKLESIIVYKTESNNHDGYGDDIDSTHEQFINDVQPVNPVKPKPETQNSDSGRIAQMDLMTNVVVNSFASQSEASKETGIDSSSIGKVLRKHRKSAGGFGWILLD